jgi:hypothetical protein
MSKLKSPNAPVILTALGAIPFLVPAGLMVIYRADTILLNTIGLWLLVYAAVILSFLGGVRWGVEIVKREKPRFGELALSVMGALIGWIAVMAFFRFTAPWIMGALSCALVLHYLVDRASLDMPVWYRRLRLWPTLAAALCLLLAFALLG